MNANINENVVLYDWFSFTTKKHTPEEVIAALGLSHCPWTEMKGARGFVIGFTSVTSPCIITAVRIWAYGVKCPVKGAGILRT